MSKNAEDTLNEAMVYFDAAEDTKLGDTFWTALTAADSKLRKADRVIAKTLTGSYEGLYGYFAGVTELHRYVKNLNVVQPQTRVPPAGQFLYINVDGTSQQLALTLPSAVAELITKPVADISQIWSPSTTATSTASTASSVGAARPRGSLVEADADGDASELALLETAARGPMAMGVKTVKGEGEGQKRVFYAKSWKRLGNSRLAALVAKTVIEDYQSQQGKLSLSAVASGALINPCMQANTYLLFPATMAGADKCVLSAPSSTSAPLNWNNGKICKHMKEVLGANYSTLFTAADKVEFSPGANGVITLRVKGASDVASAMLGSPDYNQCRELVRRVMLAGGTGNAVLGRAQVKTVRNVVRSASLKHVLYNSKTAGSAVRHIVLKFYRDNLDIKTVPGRGHAMSSPVGKHKLSALARQACAPFTLAPAPSHAFMCLSVVAAEQTIFGSDLLDLPGDTQVVFSAYSNAPAPIRWTEGAALLHHAIYSAYADTDRAKISSCELSLAETATAFTPSDPEDRLVDLYANCKEVAVRIQDFIDGPPSAPVEDLFPKNAWRQAVQKAFGPEGLMRYTAVGPLPRLQCYDEVSGQPGAGRECAAHERGPEYRAVSLKLLKQIAEFIQELAKSREGADYNALPNMDPKFGRGCFNNPQTPCMEDRNCPTNDMCGVDRRVLVEDVSMYIINRLLVMPLTKPHQVSFAEMMGGGKPHFFVSHFWGGSFLNFVKSLDFHKRNHEWASKHSDEDVRYWVCTFANNQHRASEELGDKPQDSPFAKAIVMSQEVVPVQDDAVASLSLTLNRIWCVFEMQWALEQKKKISFVCENGFLKQDGSTTSKCSTSFFSMMTSWDPAKAQYTSKDDYDKILTHINAHNLCAAGAAPATGTTPASGVQCLQQKMKQYTNGLQGSVVSRHISPDRLAARAADAQGVRPIEERRSRAEVHMAALRGKTRMHLMKGMVADHIKKSKH